MEQLTHTVMLLRNDITQYVTTIHYNCAVHCDNVPITAYHVTPVSHTIITQYAFTPIAPHQTKLLIYRIIETISKP